ncbi:MAG: FixH family protein [Patescibacteria group bacterium]
MKNYLTYGLVIVFMVGILWLVFGASNSGSSQSTSGGSSQISMSTNPNPPSGNTNFIISVKDDKGNPVKDAKVSFDLNMTSMNMGTQQGAATSQGDGTYVAAGRLTMRGPWRVSAKVAMPDGKEMNQDFDINY